MKDKQISYPVNARPCTGEELEIVTSMKIRMDLTVPKNEIHIYQDGKRIGSIKNIRVEE